MLILFKEISYFFGKGLTYFFGFLPILSGVYFLVIQFSFINVFAQLNNKFFIHINWCKKYPIF